MGWFDVTLVLLEEPQERDQFLGSFNEKLASVNVKLDIDDYEFITYNDTRFGEEKEVTALNEGMNTKDVLELLSKWPALGLLSYRHPDFSHCVTINYLSWDDNLIYGFTIGFNGKEVGYGPKEERSLELINQISDLVDYNYVIGSIDDDVNIDFENDFSNVLKYIRSTKFGRIDKRKNTTNI